MEEARSMPDNAHDLVRFEQRDGVAVVTLNDPARRNAFSGALVHALAVAMDRAEGHEATRCVVVTGAGPAFCAGAELATLRGAADGAFDDVDTVYQGFLRVRDCPLPTIAAVNGPAVGAGFNLALACDVRLAGPDALFDARFTALRVHPGGGHAWMLARAVGQQQAMLACLFGEVWDARAAVATGLAAALVEEDLIDAAVALASRLAEQEKAYVQRLTATLRGALSTPEYADALAEETAAQRWSAGRPAFRAGVRALEDHIARRD
jgi:enoyl-CoA hydratase